MLMTEYNEARHISNEKEISYEQGREDGLEQGLKEGKRLERLNTERERIRAEVFKYKLQGKSNEEISELMQVAWEQVEEILGTI